MHMRKALEIFTEYEHKPGASLYTHGSILSIVGKGYGIRKQANE